MRKLTILLLFLFLCGTAARATVTAVHKATGTGLSCSPSCGSFTLGFTATSGNLIVIAAYSTTNVHISAVTCTPACTGTSWVFPANCAAYLAATGAVSCAYVLAVSSAATAVTATMSASGSTTYLEVREYHSSLGTFTAETVPAGTTNASCSTCTTPAVTITGSSDVLLAGIATGNSGCSVASPWGNFTTPSGDGAADYINTNSGTGATFTQGTACPTGAAAAASMITIGFKEPGGAAVVRHRAQVIQQ